MNGTFDKVVRIGGASGAWGDSRVAVPQLIRRGRVDYLVFDYLAELTMSILAAARSKNPELGYATDFVDITLQSSLRDIKEGGIRVVSNAGGVNPLGCAQAIAAIAESQGVSVKIAAVVGDDAMSHIPALRLEGTREIQTGESLPDNILTANAYLGALPIARALDEGADIVVTGRCVDSAVTLGVLMHEFGWSHSAYDKLAQGSLAGHTIECGCQATGGLYTDWQDVPGWDDIGYPILECKSDGSFTVTKPDETGGLVTPSVIAEQILYEIGDPAAYMLPDVICDFSNVQLNAVGKDRVAVSGAAGRAPSSTYKVTATYADGYKCSGQLTVIGFDAPAKLRRTANAILSRTRAIFRELKLPDYTETNLEILGAESLYGAHCRAEGTREAVMRLTVRHPDRNCLEIFSREISPAGISWAPGTTGLSGRPKPSRLIKQFAFLLPKSRLSPQVVIDSARLDVAIPAGGAEFEHKPPLEVSVVGPEPVDEESVDVPLLAIAHGRSGDKGDACYIGIIARRPELLPIVREQVTEEKVAAYLQHLVLGKVTRFDAPGLHAVNFVCERALGGGGMASLRNDPWGKGMAQILLAMPVIAPRKLVSGF